MPLDEGTTEAVSAAGLYLLGHWGFLKETAAGFFVDMISSDEAQKKTYGAFSKAQLEFWAAQLQEISQTESVIKTAIFTDLTVAEFFNRERHRRRFPDKKIQWLVLQTSGQGGTANYVFSFDNTFTDNLVYVIRGNENGSNGSLEEAVAKAANEVAQFFNGSAKRIGPEEMYSEETGEETPSKKAGGFGIFYCAHTDGLPNAAVRVRANFSIRKVLRFVKCMAEAAGYGQAQIDVRYGNLNPEELAAITDILPISKMSAVKEVTLQGLKAEDLKSETLSSYIGRAVICALSINPEPSLFAAQWLFDYDSSSGPPRVTVTPATPGLHVDNNRFERELSRVVSALFDDHDARGLVPRTGDPLYFPEIGEGSALGSALIRLAFSPGPSVLKEAFDALFPGIYFVKELRYRSRVKGEDLAQALQA